MAAARIIVDQADVLAVMRAGGPPLAAAEIAAAIGTSRAAAHRTLKRMTFEGALRWIKRENGGPGYVLPVAPPVPVAPDATPVPPAPGADASRATVGPLSTATPSPQEPL
ncbi:MAG: MarR family transcriptional regulator [Sphingomonadaceae bacterium]|nr:MarR family transcriptional regulator [Sphingomonadaceae bacterium]